MGGGERGERSDRSRERSRGLRRDSRRHERSVEEGNNDSQYGEGFNDAVIRNKFIRKVYSILTIQLTFTTVVVGIFVLVEEVFNFVKSHYYLIYIALGIYIVTFFMLTCCCCVTLRRTFPLNVLLLILLTLALSFLAGVIACQYSPYSVLAALAATAIITFGLTIFAIQTKHDFTSCPGIICMMSLFFMAAGIIVSIIFATYGYSKILDMVYCAVGVLVFMIYIVYDTQRLIGGKNRENPINPEDYVYAATQLYVDIVELFLYLLRLMGNSDG